MLTAVIIIAGFWAGLQNALAGGGSFVTLPVLILSGMSPLAANLTSTVALFPGQVTSGLAGRKLVSGAGRLPFWALFLASILGGALGGVLLLKTPSHVFTLLVPWLVLAATLIFCWGSFRRKSLHSSRVPTPVLALIQFVIGIYGGYFGGGIGILMLAALTIAGQQVRTATATKNVLAMAMNTSAVGLFAFSSQIDWLAAVALAIGGIAGGLTGSWLVHRLPEKIMRGFVVVVGFGLTGWLFWR